MEPPMESTAESSAHMDNISIHSSNSPSTQSGSRPTTDDSVEQVASLKTRLLSKETKAITYGKLFMIFLLLAITSGSAVAVYKYTKSEQDDEFKVHFEDIAYQIFSVYRVNAAKVIDIYMNFATQISAFAIGVNQVWPNVTVSGFEALASSAMNQSGSTSLVVSHIVTKEQRSGWESYTVEHGAAWVEESFRYRESDATRPVLASVISDLITGEPVNDTVEGYDFYSAVWQYSPVVDATPVSNVDLFGHFLFPDVYDDVVKTNLGVISAVQYLNEPSDDRSTWPISFLTMPVYKDVVQEPTIDNMVAQIVSDMPWHSYFEGLLPEGIEPVILVVSNDCNQTFSFLIDGPHVEYLGPTDQHIEKYRNLIVSTDFHPDDVTMHCSYTFSLSPTHTFEAKYDTNHPTVYTAVVVAIFLFTIAVFIVYDCFVELRQHKVMTTAERSNAIVTSLFPQEVADRLMDDVAEGSGGPTKNLGGGKGRHSLFAEHEKWTKSMDKNDISSDSKPIAELFPSASVMFADIVGFTAWASEREPSQVFELLEQIYSSFDHIAKRKKVFKVETIGDCYMAAAGLPERRADHAIVMARFARDCLRKMLHVVRKLEANLGPSTGELSMRVGIHSGPVTAGVLRGEKARFQLFGDTVNTAARMESTGVPNKIQVSAETAALIKAGDDQQLWVIPREDEVEAKGKGRLKTFWVGYSSGSASRASFSASSGDVSSTEEASETFNDLDIETEVLVEDSEQKKLDRSIDWTTDVLLALLKRVVGMRGSVGSRPVVDAIKGVHNTRPLEEVVEVINFQGQQKSYLIEPAKVSIPLEAVMQLRSFVREVASTYNQNYFHNFEHATHVTMSVTKLLSRVVTPDVDLVDGDDEEREMHEYTFGITSDPLAQFAVAFAALIHDVDHQGVPNATLVKERSIDAIRYRNKSVAEQNSVDIAWELLALDCYSNLRSCIYVNEQEFLRFRQLVVNAVMATDIVDKELGAVRKARWHNAFNRAPVAPVTEAVKQRDANRKATIVIEHLIQASDVAHTMQHWHVYIRWNERYFCECYVAYLDGRSDKDPSVDWYESELGFFDFYIIPLAKKLRECQVFGVASDEYLNYAEANRQEWELKGKDLVRGYLEHFRSMQMSDNSD